MQGSALLVVGASAALLEEAAERARMLGLATIWVDRPQPAPSHRDRPVTGWDALTRAERRVAELVAEGLTNREVADRLFTSRHTVASQLKAVFRKLGVGSRVGLARVALSASAVA
jgi:DNA-binding CsgD family transcriptional regulator